MSEMKYKYKHSNKVIRNEIIKTPRIQKLIKEFLIEKLRLEKLYSPPKIVYIDETHIHINDVNKKILLPMDENKQVKINKTVGKGTRYTVIHAGGQGGFIKNSHLILKNTEVDSSTFEDWIENVLMPEVPENSVVIYDNCSVHSRQYNKTPNSSTNKQNIKNWLNFNNISFDDNLKKHELLNLVKKIQLNPVIMSMT